MGSKKYIHIHECFRSGAGQRQKLAQPKIVPSLFFSVFNNGVLYIVNAFDFPTFNLYDNDSHLNRHGFYTYRFSPSLSVGAIAQNGLRLQNDEYDTRSVFQDRNVLCMFFKVSVSSLFCIFFLWHFGDYFFSVALCHGPLSHTDVPMLSRSPVRIQVPILFNVYLGEFCKYLLLSLLLFLYVF